MRASATAVTQADRDALYAWWTDYSERDHAGHAFARYAKVSRRVVWREPKAVEIVDEGALIGVPVELRTLVELTPPERVRAITTSPRGVLRSDWWFEAMPGGGTRVTAHAEFEEHPVARVVAPITETALAGALGYDLRAHLREYDAEKRG